MYEHNDLKTEKLDIDVLIKNKVSRAKHIIHEVEDK